MFERLKKWNERRAVTCFLLSLQVAILMAGFAYSEYRYHMNTPRIDLTRIEELAPKDDALHPGFALWRDLAKYAEYGENTGRWSVEWSDGMGGSFYEVSFGESRRLDGKWYFYPNPRIYYHHMMGSAAIDAPFSSTPIMLHNDPVSESWCRSGTFEEDRRSAFLRQESVERAIVAAYTKVALNRR